MSEITQALHAAARGEPGTAEALLPVVYEELRHLAAIKMAQEPLGQNLQATSLVHEAWLRLAEGPEREWNDRQHFFRAAAEAMRRILVDHARERQSRKRGGDRRETELTESKIVAPANTDDDLLAVHDVLEELGRLDSTSAELVKLRYFVGLSMAEAASALNVPLRTAERMWTFARAWLREEIQRGRA